MNTKTFALQIGLGLALGISGVVWGTAPASAITDTTGVIITSGDIVGGVWSPGEGAEEVIVFRTTPIRDAVYRAASSVNQQLAQRNLPVVANRTPRAIPASVLQNMEILLTGTGNVNLSLNQIQNALVNAGANPTLAQNLASNLSGLTTGGTVNAAQFAAVVSAYNALINASGVNFLIEPPEELRAIQSVLGILLNAGLATN